MYSEFAWRSTEVKALRKLSVVAITTCQALLRRISVRCSQCSVCLQIISKKGGTTYELFFCRTASRDPVLLRSYGVKTCEIYRRMIALRTKRRCLLSKGALVFHDNAPSHSAAVTVQATRQLKFELLPHHSTGPTLGRLNRFDAIGPRAYGGIRARVNF